MSNRISWRPLAVAVTTVLLLAACGSSDDLGGEVVADGLGCQPTRVDLKTDDVPTLEPAAEPAGEVETEDLEEGEGCAIDTDTYVTLDLIGATATDAKVFNDTFAAKRPVTATLGTGQLLPGLETGLEGMKVGGRRRIVVPADLAYGAEGNLAQGIASDQTLVFVVDLVAVTDTPLYCNAATGIPAGPEGSAKPTTVDMPIEPPTDEVVKKDLTEGTGDPVEAGNYVTLDYLGIACSTGQQFDTSWDTGKEPISITLGEGTIPGFSAGIEGMKLGGVRQIEIPAAQAYGAQGSPPSIGTNDPLVFIISVTDVAETPPTTTTLPVETTVPADPSTTVPAEGDGDGSTTVPAEGDGSTTTVAPSGDETTTTTP